MSQIDVLVITALKEEFEAARDAATISTPRGIGVCAWVEQDSETSTPYLLGDYLTPSGRSLKIALARSTRMGATSTSPIAGALIEKLKPICLAMCGVCAGNPEDLALGDVVISEMVYAYDEGKQKADGFEGDARPIQMLEDWLRTAQDLSPTDLPSYGAASSEEAPYWMLERLHAGDDPAKHPARRRYIHEGTWGDCLKFNEQAGYINREGDTLKLTAAGTAIVQNKRLEDIEGPKTLPFEIKVGPIASGNWVVKDGITWSSLKARGVRTAIGLEMEAAAIGTAAHRLGIAKWIVVKGVMDHADPRKDDRFKRFAARASAEVLFKFLALKLSEPSAVARNSTNSLARRIYVVGGVTLETEYAELEPTELITLCNRLGAVIASSGAELVVCSPFPDSADVHTASGYVNSGLGGSINFHSPLHEDVAQAKKTLGAMLGKHKTRLIDWDYPAPEASDRDSWRQAWLLCQIQALENSDIVISIGGRLSKSANTILHLAEARGVPIVPFSFFGGASKRAFERRDWPKSHPKVAYQRLTEKTGIADAIVIVNQLMSDAIHSPEARNSIQTVFISRARADSGFSDALCSGLKNAGLEPMLGDGKIKSDRMVRPAIEDAIRESDVVVILWSSAYAKSPWCYDELDFTIQHAHLNQSLIWICNIDGSDVVPRHARALHQVMTQTPQELVHAVLQLITNRVVAEV